MPKITLLRTKLLAKIYFHAIRPWLICFWLSTTKRLPTHAIGNVPILHFDSYGFRLPIDIEDCDRKMYWIKTITAKL